MKRPAGHGGEPPERAIVQRVVAQLPGSLDEVEGSAVRIVREKSSSRGRGQTLLERIRGRATSGLSTEEIMALTRGEAPTRPRLSSL